LIAEDHNGLRFAARRRVGWNQPTAHHGGDAPVIWGLGRNRESADVFRKTAIGGGEIPSLHCHNALERFEVAKFIDFRAAVAGHAVVALVVQQVDFHDAIRVGIWVRVEQDGVDHREDSGGGADAESQGENGGQSDAGRLRRSREE